MKRVIAALVAIVIPLLFIASCTATMTYTLVAFSHLKATHYTNDEQVHRAFPVLVVIPSKQPHGDDEIHYVPWDELPRFLRDHPHHSFHLPKKEGELPPFDSEPGGVRFTVTAQRGNTQIIEVADSGDLYALYSRYEATDKTISPRYFRVLAYSLAILAFPVGLGLTWLLFYGLKRWVRSRLRRLAPNLDVRALTLSRATSEWLLLLGERFLKKQPLSQ